MRYVGLLAGIGLLLAVTGTAGAVTITVPGLACPHFAGQDVADLTGSGVPYFYGDAQSACLPPYVDITGFVGGPIDISATGGWSHSINSLPENYAGPDGSPGSITTYGVYAVFGIRPLLGGNLDLLVGVFLTDDPPDPGYNPGSLTVGTSDMTTPALQQVFAIGSSLGGITIPTDATRLFFGLNDGYTWRDNAGSLDVTVVPEPVTMAGLMLGVGCLARYVRRRRRPAH